MELTDAVLGDVPLLVATGAIDRTACGVLEAALRRILESRHNMVFLDLSSVTTMDSAGLSVLHTWVEALGGRGWLGVIGPNADIRSLLVDAGLLGHPNVRFFETTQAARVATGERQST